MFLNVQLAGVACMVMDVRKPLLHGLDTLRGLLTDEAPRQFGNEDVLDVQYSIPKLVKYEEIHPDLGVHKICGYIWIHSLLGCGHHPLILPKRWSLEELFLWVHISQPLKSLQTGWIMFETYPQQDAKKQYSFALGEQNFLPSLERWSYLTSKLLFRFELKSSSRLNEPFCD